MSVSFVGTHLAPFCCEVNMKKILCKLVITTILFSSLVTQIGCGNFGPGDEYEICYPDRLVQSSVSVHKEYNGKSMGDDYVAIGPTMFINVDGVDNVEGKGSTPTVELANGVISKLDGFTIGVYNVTSGSEMKVPEMPIQKNETKTFSVQTQINGDYYDIKNVSNAKVVNLPPVGWWYVFEYWQDDVSFQLHQEADNINRLLHIVVNDVDTLDWNLTYETTTRSSNTRDEFYFPYSSPTATMEVGMQDTTKTWNGNATIKVLENKDRKISFEETYSISDGTNVYQQTSTSNYQFADHECETHYQD